MDGRTDPKYRKASLLKSNYEYAHKDIQDVQNHICKMYDCTFVLILLIKFVSLI